MTDKTINHIQLVLKETIRDTAGEHLQEAAQKFLQIQTGRIKTGKIFSVLYDLTDDQVQQFAHESLQDKLLHDVYINRFYQSDEFASYILVSKLPGVTDDEGVSAQKAMCDLFNLPFDYSHQWIFTQDIFYFEARLSEKELKLIGSELLGNPLINHFEYGKFTGAIQYIPEVRMHTDTRTETIDIFVDDEALLQLSKKMLLALDLREMKAIQEYYRNPQTQQARQQAGMPQLPTDCELEVLAQTWSEHCKHKEFNALITYKDLETGEERQIDSLFKTFIKGSTDLIKERLEKQGKKWLLKVFADNAGVVRIDDNRVFTWKVETHNSPSALDPYGGALTGIVGVNRDPLGTGVGGGKLLFNTNVLCFGSPYYDGQLLPGQLHPRRIMSGVVKGIEDGGNKSGIPTVNGSIIFDDRYRGKPLVFAGTGAVMPAKLGGRNSWEKQIDPGDRILMAGGRVGKDGIHGATFSSQEIDEHSPRSAVQIGSPITQKNMSDFMERAAQAGLIKCSTDNGAGGLSSSIGELATIPGGAVVELEKVPLKYAGLKPWEIFVSESQERMTLVVEPPDVPALLAMAADFEVEVTDIGYFTDSGVLDVRYGEQRILYLDMDFLHDGVPKKYLEAEWKPPQVQEPILPKNIDYQDILFRLMGSLNICSREPVIRRYDHEVKGKSIIKPLMGDKGRGPQDAAVMRLDFDSYVGLAIANGIHPRYGDIDAYHMSAGAFDEAVRSIIAVGGKLPDWPGDENLFWTVNDNFCVPDSVYHPQNNPDGKYKLAQLVRMNQALYDMATFFNIPMTSGKDSMKNDFIKEGIKISVPPTILYSVVAKIPDVRRTITAEFKRPGDLIYLVGQTFDELGGSEFYQLFGELGAHVPIVRPELAARVYGKMQQAHEQAWLHSAHDISDGGLAVALAESAFGGELGALVNIPKTDLSLPAFLFSE
ncbi:MAG TPA: phosphoribosylformylglycinamidine synthase, partial [Caldithrix abyssi]|nr:phosphoribosylformylglycinamidine synthase [Caldithrix abyssi]